MRKKIIIFTIIIVTFFTSGCGININFRGIGNSLVIENKVRSMSVEEKLCQMIMPVMRTWSDTPEDADSYYKVEKLNDEQKEFLREYNFGGICLFAENCTGTEQLARLTSEIQEAAYESDTKIPMLISVDQEGGYVTRLGTGTSGVGNMALAASGDSENARREAEIIGKELYAEGLNIDFGPVSDVNSNPYNPVIGIRSFSDDPEVVSEYANAYIEGLHNSGVMSCAKHFPGHGDTETDSHVGFPVIMKEREELNKTELVPFREAASLADMIMTAHIQFPMVETETYTSVSTGEEVYLPATMSKTIIKGILRKDIGYNGVVSTDALDMGAISDNFEGMDAAKLAINADVDILLVPVEIKNSNGIENMKKYIADLTKLVKSGEIAEEELDDSVIRILTLKEKYGLSDCFSADTESKVSNALKVVGSEDNHDEEWEIALDSVTCYKEMPKDCPGIDKDTKILCFCAWDSMANSVEMARRKLVEAEVLSDEQEIKTISYDGISVDNSADYKNEIEDSDIVILISKTNNMDSLDISNPDNFIANFCSNILKISKAASKKTILISSHLPYDVNTFDADAVYLSFNPMGVTEIPTEYNGEVKKYSPCIPAAVYTALGGQEATGICPVSIPE